MGVKGAIGPEAASYVHGKYGEKVNTLLAQIGTILFDCEIDLELSNEIGTHIAEIAAVNFIAGIEFGAERPQAAAQLRRSEVQPSGASSSNGG